MSKCRCTPECTLESFEGIPQARKESILKIADDAIQMLLLEIEEGDSSGEYKALTPEENAFFWAAIHDGVTDSTDE